MILNTWGKRLALITLLFMGSLACSTTSNLFVAQATLIPSRTPLPTFTPFPDATETAVPTITTTPAPTKSPTATARPATPKPTAAPKVVVPTTPPQPVLSSMEFHVNPATCSHSGLTFIKFIVYLNKSDPSQRYQGAIVALGPPDGSTIYDIILSEWNGEYTFVLGDAGKARPGNWGVWLVTPSRVRKSDIGGPIVTNDLPADNPKACWAGGVDFWK